MGRAPCCDKSIVKKGPWSPEEDAKLKDFIEKFGTGGNWIALPQKAGLKRCGKSCRLRWLNYLRPNIRHGEFSDDEDRIICSLYANIGSRWSVIAAQLPGRTDNDIKNYWNTKLKKKILTMHHEKPTFLFPYMPFQPPPPPPSDQFLTTSSSVYTYNTPNFMINGDNTSNSLLLHDDHINNVTHLSPPPPPPSAYNLMSNNNTIDVNIDHNYLGFQDEQSPMQEYYHSTESAMSQVSHGNYNKDNHQNQQSQIKQEVDQMILQDQIQSQSFLIDQKPKEYMIKNHVSSDLNGYLFHDHGDGNMALPYYH